MVFHAHLRALRKPFSEKCFSQISSLCHVRNPFLENMFCRVPILNSWNIFLHDILGVFDRVGTSSVLQKCENFAVWDIIHLRTIYPVQPVKTLVLGIDAAFRERNDCAKRTIFADPFSKGLAKLETIYFFWVRIRHRGELKASWQHSFWPLHYF